MLTLWRRHRKKCPHADDRYYRQCRCPVHVEGTVEGKYYRHSLKTNSWERGEQLKRQREDGIVPKEQSKSITIKDALDAFIADCEARNLAANTRSKYKQLRDRITEFCERTHVDRLADLQPENVRRFREGRALGALTSGKELGHLRTFFHFCIEREWITRNPAAIIKAPQVKELPRLPYIEKEIQNILAQAQDDKELAFILTLRYTGLRIGDASLLRVSALTGNRIHLRTAKSGAPVSILIPETLVNLLKQLPATGGYFFLRGESTHPHTASDLWRKRIKAICKTLKIRPDHPHRFRHSLACELLNKGASVEQVAAILGNSPAIVVKHYSQWIKSRQDALDAMLAKTWEEPKLALVKK